MFYVLFECKWYIYSVSWVRIMEDVIIFIYLKKFLSLCYNYLELFLFIKLVVLDIDMSVL